MIDQIIHSQEHISKGILNKNCQICWLIYLQCIKLGKNPNLKVIENE